MLGDEPPLKPLIDLPRMAEKTADMLRRALDACVRRDADAARAITKEDDEVDAPYMTRSSGNSCFSWSRIPRRSGGLPGSSGRRTIWSAPLTASPTSAGGRVVFVVTGHQEEIGGKY
ncbi:MAG: PhoU domain-containing protein [Dehalogenimonas sp.]